MSNSLLTGVLGQLNITVETALSPPVTFAADQESNPGWVTTLLRPKVVITGPGGEVVARATPAGEPADSPLRFLSLVLLLGTFFILILWSDL